MAYHFKLEPQKSFTVFKNKSMQNSNNYLLVNLSISDLMTIFICIPIAIHDLHSKERWYLGEYLCKFVPFIENCMCVVSVLTFLVISIDRLVVVLRPFEVSLKF